MRLACDGLVVISCLQLCQPGMSGCADGNACPRPNPNVALKMVLKKRQSAEFVRWSLIAGQES